MAWSHSQNGSLWIFLQPLSSDCNAINNDKGYGFIKRDTEEDVFVQYSAITLLNRSMRGRHEDDSERGSHGQCR